MAGTVGGCRMGMGWIGDKKEGVSKRAVEDSDAENNLANCTFSLESTSEL